MKSLDKTRQVTRFKLYSYIYILYYFIIPTGANYN